jgi:signal transduction histidine kinase
MLFVDLNQLRQAPGFLNGFDAQSQNPLLALLLAGALALNASAVGTDYPQPSPSSHRIRPYAAWVRSDPILLERIVGNLVGNALRYTREGGVLLGCRREGERLRIEVWDTGIGIPPDKHEAIFAEFYQVAPGGHLSGGGLGLGLAIVARLCELLGHEVQVASRSGRGSRRTPARARITTSCAGTGPSPAGNPPNAGAAG